MKYDEPRHPELELASRQPTRTATPELTTSRPTSTRSLTSNAIVTSQNQTLGQKKQHKRYQMILVACGFFMVFNVIGINWSYGIFQEYYTSSQTHIKGTEGQDALVSLIGSIGAGLTWSGGIIAGPIMARAKHVQWVTLFGVVTMSVGLMLVSICTKVWQLFLTEALLYGLGSSFYYFPIIAITPLYFDRHRALAMGIVLSGAGAGGLVFAPLVRTLIDTVGAPWTFRILGIWNLAVGLPIAFLVKYRPGYRPQGRTRLTWDLLRRGTFVYQAIGAFLQAAGNLVPMYFMTSYSTSILSHSRSYSALLLATHNAVNLCSRITMGYLADHLGRQNTMLISVLLSAISVLALWYDASQARFIAFIVMYGIYAGGYNALLPTTVAEVYGVQHYASVNSSIYFIRGLGSMAGAPLAGLILGSYARGAREGGEVDVGLQKRYKDVVVYDGVLLMAATLAVANVRWFDAREKGWKWKA
ncbi:major facilitator superfamily domain-containing protein [Pterulicium gracile]|uniref:Major facilitator superfamily domain-containing protein n=1 Tax=Pterulicium gracile TaxID=1884261 RepID=A0A5C3QKV9_9AGAR|nr:major facilitator superfamily domain-containing protein [Pterula gracilis]